MIGVKYFSIFILQFIYNYLLLYEIKKEIKKVIINRQVVFLIYIKWERE